jgi:DNA-binding GntR family transcriptional regulator
VEEGVSGTEEREAGDAVPLPSRIAALIVERVKFLKLAPDSHLAEQSLADAFHVSRTPVRIALKILEAKGMVERRRNCGYFVLEQIYSAPGEEMFFEESATDPFYLQIAEDRLNGDLPMRFTEAELARRYQLSKARLARLLARMTREGWLDRRPGHGWEFQPVLTSPDAFDQANRFRILIEPAALMEPGYQVDEVAFKRVRAQLQALLVAGEGRFSAIETFQVGVVFHETIVAGSGNLFLLDALRRVNRLRRLIEYRARKDHSRVVEECTDHLQLLDLLEQGRRAEAVTVLRCHLEKVSRIKLDRLRAAQAEVQAEVVGEAH